MGTAKYEYKTYSISTVISTEGLDDEKMRMIEEAYRWATGASLLEEHEIEVDLNADNEG